MADDDAKSFSIPWVPLITVLAAGSGILLMFPPVNSSRPPAAGVKQEYSQYSDEDVDARLWQDPLGAVRDEVKNSPGDLDWHRLAKLREDIVLGAYKAPAEDYPDSCQMSGSDRQNLIILPVFMRAGAYAEEVEQRLRWRLAVLEGLEVGGFAPEDREHIGYFDVP